MASRILSALAWDAQVDERSGSPINTAPVKLSIQQLSPGRATLTVTPDAQWLLAPEREFPVTVDPTYASVKVSPSYDAFVQTGSTSDQSGSTELRLGTFDGGTTKARSFMTFPSSGIKGKKIMSASLSLYEFHSYSCSSRSWEVWKTGLASTWTRWTSQPSWISEVASTSATKGYSSSCPDGRVSQNVKSLVQGWADSSGDCPRFG